MAFDGYHTNLKFLFNFFEFCVLKILCGVINTVVLMLHISETKFFYQKLQVKLHSGLDNFLCFCDTFSNQWHTILTNVSLLKNFTAKCQISMFHQNSDTTKQNSLRSDKQEK